jgi:uncharacterized protein YmfQ (DUF2313 family)
MAVTAAKALLELKKFSPRGQLWDFLRGGFVERLLKALGDGLVATEADIDTLTTEADPRTTSQLLPDWEATCGLPDGCVPGGGSTAQRRNAVVGRLVATGGASRAYLIGLAAKFGYVITIDEPAPFTFRVTSPLASGLVYSTCNGTCDDQLQTFGVAQLECLIERVKPAHTAAEFAYTG